MAIVSNRGYRDPHIPNKVLAKKVHHNPSSATVRGIVGISRFTGAEYWPLPGTLPVNTVVPVLTIAGGEPIVGNVIAAADISTGTWNGDPVPTYSKVLKLNGVAKTLPYTILIGDLGKTFTVEVTATNTIGAVTQASVASLPVVGVELYVDGGMSATTGITATNVTLAIVSGQLQMTTTIAGGDTSSSRFLSGLAAGQSFRARATMKRGTCTNVNLIAYSGDYLAVGSLITATIDTATEINFTLPVAITNFTLYSQMVGSAIGQTGFVDNISVRRTG